VSENINQFAKKIFLIEKIETKEREREREREREENRDRISPFVI